MFKFIEGLPQDVMAIEATGKVTHEDYKSILIPKAEAMMSKGPIKMLYVIGKEFTGFEAGALWDDIGARRSPAGRASTGCLVGRLSLMTGCRRWRPGFPVPAVLGQLADPGGQVDARGLSHRGSRVGDGWPGRPALRGWSLRAWGRCGPGGSSPSPGS